MERLGDLTDWVWLVVVLIWVVVQILPRLLRGEKKKSAERARPRPARVSAPQGPPETMRNPDAKPIEPR